MPSRYKKEMEIVIFGTAVGRRDLQRMSELLGKYPEHIRSVMPDYFIWVCKENAETGFVRWFLQNHEYDTETLGEALNFLIHRNRVDLIADIRRHYGDVPVSTRPVAYS